MYVLIKNKFIISTLRLYFLLQDFIYPEGVAYPIGGIGQDQFVVIEIHYDNPQNTPGITLPNAYTKTMKTNNNKTTPYRGDGQFWDEIFLHT